MDPQSKKKGKRTSPNGDNDDDDLLELYQVMMDDDDDNTRDVSRKRQKLISREDQSNEDENCIPSTDNIRNAVNTVNIKPSDLQLFKEEFPRFCRSIGKDNLKSIIDSCFLIQRNFFDCTQGRPISKQNPKWFETNFPIWSHTSDFYNDDPNDIKMEFATDIYYMIISDDLLSDALTKDRQLIESCLQLFRNLISIRSSSSAPEGVIDRWIKSMIYISCIFDELKKVKKSEKIPSNQSVPEIFLHEIFENKDGWNTVDGADREFNRYRDVSDQMTSSNPNIPPKPTLTYLFREFMALDCPRSFSLRPILWAIQEAGIIASNIFMSYLLEDVLIENCINEFLLYNDNNESNQIKQSKIININETWKKYTDEISTGDLLEKRIQDYSRLRTLQIGMNEFWKGGSALPRNSSTGVNGIPNGIIYIWKDIGNMGRVSPFLQYINDIANVFRDVSDLINKVDNVKNITQNMFSIGVSDPNQQIKVEYLIQELYNSFRDSSNATEHWEDAMLTYHGIAIKRQFEELTVTQVFRDANARMSDIYRNHTESLLTFQPREMVREVNQARSRLNDAVLSNNRIEINKQIDVTNRLHNKHLPRASLSARIYKFCLQVSSLFDDLYGLVVSGQTDNILSTATYIDLLLQDYGNLLDVVECLEIEISKNIQNKILKDTKTENTNINRAINIIKEGFASLTRKEEGAIFNSIINSCKIGIKDVPIDKRQSLVTATRYAHFTLDCALGHTEILLEKMINDTSNYGLYNKERTLAEMFPNGIKAFERYLETLEKNIEKIDRINDGKDNSRIWWERDVISNLPFKRATYAGYTDSVFKESVNKLNSLLKEYVDIAYYNIITNEELEAYNNMLKMYNIPLGYELDELIRKDRETTRSKSNAIESENGDKSMSIRYALIKDRIYKYKCPDGDDDNGGNKPPSFGNIKDIIFSNILASPIIVQNALIYQRFPTEIEIFKNYISESTPSANRRQNDGGLLPPKFNSPIISLGSNLLLFVAGILMYILFVRAGREAIGGEVYRATWYGKLLYVFGSFTKFTSTNTQRNNLKLAIDNVTDDLTDVNKIISMFPPSMALTSQTLLDHAGRFTSSTNWIANSIAGYGLPSDLNSGISKTVYETGIYMAAVVPIQKVWAGLPILSGIFAITQLFTLANAGFVFSRSIIGFKNTYNNNNVADGEESRKTNPLYNSVQITGIIGNVLLSFGTLVIDSVSLAYASTSYVNQAIISLVVGGSIFALIGFGLNEKKKGSIIASIVTFGGMLGQLLGNASGTVAQLWVGSSITSFITNPALLWFTFIGGAVSVFSLYLWNRNQPFIIKLSEMINQYATLIGLGGLVFNILETMNVFKIWNQ